jgi:hypothetical protein
LTRESRPGNGPTARNRLFDPAFNPPHFAVPGDIGMIPGRFPAGAAARPDPIGARPAMVTTTRATTDPDRSGSTWLSPGS